MYGTSPLRTAPDPSAVLTRAVLAAAERWGLKQRELAAIIGLSEASVSRLHAGRLLDVRGKEGELSALLLRIYRSLDALVGGDDAAAQEWLRAHNAHVAGVPLERMGTVEGLVDVAGYLDGMRGRL